MCAQVIVSTTGIDQPSHQKLFSKRARRTSLKAVQRSLGLPSEAQSTKALEVEQFLKGGHPAAYRTLACPAQRPHILGSLLELWCHALWAHWVWVPAGWGSCHSKGSKLWQHQCSTFFIGKQSVAQGTAAST